jgi:hypothetical protein
MGVSVLGHGIFHCQGGDREGADRAVHAADEEASAMARLRLRLIHVLHNSLFMGSSKAVPEFIFMLVIYT